jgi:SAM-dependent methyltransferase
MTEPRTREERDRAWHRTEHQQMGREEYLAPLLAPLAIRDGNVFVDVGCGGGYINAYVAARNSLRLNLGLDLFPDTVQLARDLNPQAGSVCWMAASAEAIPLASNSVDTLVCRGVIPLAQVRLVLSEIARVLRPGASAVLLLHSWTFYLRWLSLHPARWKRSLGGLLHFSLGLWFNLTGQQLRVPWRGRSIGQTFQTAFRMRRLGAQYGMRVERVVHRPEFWVYLHKD